MQRRSFSFSKRHDDMLVTLAKKMDVSMVETIQRALEALEEKQAQREKDIQAPAAKGR